MKKYFLFLLFIFAIDCFCFSKSYVDVKLNKNSRVFNFSDEQLYVIEQDVYTETYGLYYDSAINPPFFVVCFEDITDNYYLSCFISIDDVSNAYCQNLLPEDYCTLKKNIQFLYPSYVVEALYKKNRNVIADNDRVAVNRRTFDDDMVVYHWFDHGPKSLLISNVGLILGGAYGQTVFYIKEISQLSDSAFKLITQVCFMNDSTIENLYFPNLHDGDEVTLRLKKDGDYLYVYVGEETKPRQTCCYVNNDFVAAVNQLVQSNRCDTTNLVWPKHADGTCEFKR